MHMSALLHKQLNNNTWVKGCAIIIRDDSVMQGKVKHAFISYRPKMVKGNYLQCSPYHKISSAFKYG